MWLTINNLKSTELDESVIRKILNIYPEEKLVDRDVFQSAFISGSIEYKDLKEESNKCSIPWQLFFLSLENLKTELKKIEDQRQDKISSKILAKRKGMGNVTSRRIIDRLIRLQNYICSLNLFPANPYNGSLRGKENNDAASYIGDFFNINLNEFRNKSKTRALEYLIGKIEQKNINICQGVLANKVLPNYQVVASNVYRDTSGFVIKDDRVPFVFLPSEINPAESEGRQIYTLIYLLTMIGLGEYEYSLGKDFAEQILKVKGKSAQAHSITSEFLLPTSVTENIKGEIITPTLRDELATKYKVTPTAIAVILRMRNIISMEEYRQLIPDKNLTAIKPSKHFGHPHIETSVRKFCGRLPFETINNKIKNGELRPTPAQYLIFGYVNKKGYKEYCERIGV